MTTLDSPQRTLADLRAALESRLAALEEALADPSRGESLESLILDLSRVAIEEAQAAASQACFQTKAETDRQLAQTVAAARAALDQGQAEGAELRDALEQAQQQIATLERQKEAERLAREQSEAELARERADKADRERAAEAVRKQLETERAASAELGEAAERAEQQLASRAREADQSRAAREALLADLAREREAAADLRRALAEAQSRLEAERDSGTELHRAAADARERLATLEREASQSREAHETLAAELARKRAETAKATMAMVDAQLALESARADISGVRAALDAARTRLDALAKERDTLARELKAARQWIDEVREAEAEFAALSLMSPPIEAPPADAPPSPRPTKQEVKAPTPARLNDEEGWEAVRLAIRYVFSEEIAVQVSGETCRLVDLSINGCQLLSPSALKPSHVVKVLLPLDKAWIACTGKVVWTRLEPSEGGRPLGYRAGIRFTSADESAIETFAARHGAEV